MTQKMPVLDVASHLLAASINQVDLTVHGRMYIYIYYILVYILYTYINHIVIKLPK